MMDDDGFFLKTFILGLGITGVSALAILALPSLPFAIPTFFSTVLFVSGAIGVILSAVSALAGFAGFLLPEIGQLIADAIDAIVSRTDKKNNKSKRKIPEKIVLNKQRLQEAPKVRENDKILSSMMKGETVIKNLNLKEAEEYREIIIAFKDKVKKNPNDIKLSSEEFKSLIAIQGQLTRRINQLKTQNSVASSVAPVTQVKTSTSVDAKRKYTHRK